MAEGIYKITEDFEGELCRYTGSPYAIALDNTSNAIFLSLKYSIITGLVREGDEVSIPSHTYPSVPCEIIHAGLKVRFYRSLSTLTGMYVLGRTTVIDSALRFTHNMYIPRMYMCISFTGPYKHLKLGKGGAILTDNKDGYEWFKKARFSGRGECSYHNDEFDMIGWNMYMPVETATRGLHMMPQMYDSNGAPKINKDLTLAYPDLSKFNIYTKWNQK